MYEKTCNTIKKKLVFEKNGETFLLELQLENVSPDINKECVEQVLDV